MRLPSSRLVAVGGGLVVILLILSQTTAHEFPLGTILYGVIYGSLNGLLALGLVLLFKVTRAVNFAYGAMGGVPAGITASMYLAHHLPWLVTVIMSLVLGGAVGLAVGLLVNWRFAHSPRLVLTVASIGLSQLLGGIALYVPRWFHGPSLIASFKTGLSGMHTEINPVVFDGNDLVAVLVVPFVVAAVAWFLLRTDSGRAVRAIADNPDRARLVGIPARRLLLTVWTISGVVAALAVTLAAPAQGVPLDAAAGPSILLAPLAAAVVARMDSLVVAFVAGIGLGVLEELVRLNVSKQSVETPVFLVVILVALLVQHRREGRADPTDDASWSASGSIKAVPDHLRRLPEVLAVRWILLAGLAALAIGLPSMLDASRLDQVSVGLVFAMTAVSLVVLSGWAGTVSLGQMALGGVGAVVAGDLMLHLNLDLFVSLLGAGAAGAVVAVVLGLPALRVKGLYLAVSTLAFAVAAEDFFFNPTDFGGELPASVIRPVLWKRFDLHGEGDLYFVCLGLLVLSVVLVQGIRRSRTGRVIIGTRDNPRASEAAAVPTVRVRLLAFTISGIIAGVAGGLYVIILGGVGYETFQAADSVTVFSMVVIGGMSSVPGALAGVALIQWIGIEFPDLQILLAGVGLLVVLTMFPNGLAGVYEAVRDRYLARVARSRGLDMSVWSGGTIDQEADEVPTLEAATVAAGDAPAILSCSGVNASYGPMQVLFGIDLDVREGEILALLGTNGAGKSSLLRAVSGLLPASSGRILLDGRDITREPTERIAGHGLTVMPGGRGVFPTLSVQENLRVAGWSLRRQPDQLEQATAGVFQLFPVLDKLRHQSAGNLSGGEQQMLSLAMAFLVKPKLLCIDELSLGLAPTIVGGLVEAVKDIHRQGTTVVIVEQSINVALLMAERATFLEKGQVRFSGPAADLLDRPDLLRAVFIGEADSAAPARVREAPVLDAATPEDRPALECHGLVKRFGGIVAVDSVDLTVAPRETVGLIGHNGAGKTTLFDVISGFLAPTHGRIVVDGEDVTDYPAFERAMAGLGRSFQEARLFPSLTVRETIALALEKYLPNRDPVAAAFRLPASTDSEAATADAVQAAIDLLGLHPYQDRLTGDLSTGTRRIVELACVMAQRPSVLLLDEPSGGVAQAETEALGPMLSDVAAETGCAMVVIEHDMHLLSGLCDRLVALELGRIIAEGTPAEVLSHPQVIASYLGTDESVVQRSGRSGRPGRPVRKRPLKAAGRA